MGKNIHSSRTKINKSHLRQNVFGPVEQARAERLSAKLLEVARQPKPERTEMETIQTASDEKPVEDANEEQMKDAEIDGEDVDMNDAQPVSTKKPQSRREQRRKSARSHKVQKRKAKNSIVFPNAKRTGKSGGPGLRKGKKR